MSRRINATTVQMVVTRASWGKTRIAGCDALDLGTVMGQNQNLQCPVGWSLLWSFSGLDPPMSWSAAFRDQTSQVQCWSRREWEPGCDHVVVWASDPRCLPPDAVDPMKCSALTWNNRGRETSVQYESSITIELGFTQNTYLCYILWI